MSGPAKGASKHGPDCRCDRCVGTQPGNKLAVGHGRPPDHGAYALLRLRPRAEEIADGLWALLGNEVRIPQMRPAVESTGLVGARFEAAMAALSDAADPSELRRLDQDCRGWARLWFRCLGMLGLTPESAVVLGMQVEIARGARLRAHVAERYSAEGES